MARLLLILSFAFLTQLSFAQTDSAIVIIDRDNPVIVGGNADYKTAEEAWKKYLVRNSKSKLPVDKNTPAGIYKFYIKFILSKDGSLSDIQCENDPGFGMCREAIRIVIKSKNWTPAEKGGKNIYNFGRQLFTFLVEDKSIKFTTKEPYTFYTGEDNVLDVTVLNVKDKKIKLKVSDGTVTKKGQGKYIINVQKPGKITVEVFKKRKSIGKAKFEVVEAKL